MNWKRFSKLNGEWHDYQRNGALRDLNSGGNVILLAPGLRVARGPLSAFASVGIRIAKTCGALLAVMMLAGGAQAHSHKLKSLEIVHPWCWETGAATKTVAVYMTVRNTSRRPDRLLRASASIAEKAELRAPGEGKPAKSLDAIGHGELILKQDGPHILLTGVKRQLDAYDAFVMTLVFERAGKVEVEVAVEEASKAEGAKH